jgi:2-polyprenyl-3-methyl-5-hydroxy-6-metoxy-1,4-benzoquinol methylase
VDVWVGDFLAYPGVPGSYDAVTMFSVLEHLPDPLAGLRRSCALLRDGGVLVLGLPNIGGLPRLVQGRFWRGFSLPEHLNFFSNANLATLLRRAGFEPVAAPRSENNFLLDTVYGYARKV